MAWLFWPSPRADAPPAPPQAQAAASSAAVDAPDRPDPGLAKGAAPDAGPDDAPAQPPQAVRPDGLPEPDVASIDAVPKQVRATRREAMGNANGLRSAMIAYFAAFGTWPEPGGPCPVEPPAATTAAWEGDCRTFFDELGWRPDTEEDGVLVTSCSYAVEAGVADTGTGAPDFIVVARCDGDGDGQVSEIESSRTETARLITDASVY